MGLILKILQQSGLTIMAHRLLWLSSDPICKVTNLVNKKWVKFNSDGFPLLPIQNNDSIIINNSGCRWCATNLMQGKANNQASTGDVTPRNIIISSWRSPSESFCVVKADASGGVPLPQLDLTEENFKLVLAKARVEASFFCYQSLFYLFLYLNYYGKI